MNDGPDERDPLLGSGDPDELAEQSLQRLEDLSRSSRSSGRAAKAAEPDKPPKPPRAARKRVSRPSRRSAAPADRAHEQRSFAPANVERSTARAFHRGGVSPARLAAPVAFVVAVIIVIALAIGSGPSTDQTPGKKPVPAGGKTSLSASPSPEASSPASGKSYTVKPGDTLTGIASRLHLPMADIQDLNPKVDWNNLQPGQRLKLPASGN